MLATLTETCDVDCLLNGLRWSQIVCKSRKLERILVRTVAVSTVTHGLPLNSYRLRLKTQYVVCTLIIWLYSISNHPQNSLMITPTLQKVFVSSKKLSIFLHSLDDIGISQSKSLDVSYINKTSRMPETSQSHHHTFNQVNQH